MKSVSKLLLSSILLTCLPIKSMHDLNLETSSSSSSASSSVSRPIPEKLTPEQQEKIDDELNNSESDSETEFETKEKKERPVTSKKVTEINKFRKNLLNEKLASVLSDLVLDYAPINTTYSLKMSFPGHTHPINDLIELIDGALASCSFDRTIKIWDRVSGKCIKTLSDHLGSINCIIELQDGSLASCSDDYTIKIWNRYSGECIKTISPGCGQIHNMIELKDGSLAFCSRTFSIEIWDRFSEKCILELKGHTKPADSVIQLKDGSLASISSFSDDKTIKIWNMDPKSETYAKCIKTFKNDLTGMYSNLIELKSGLLACCPLFYYNTPITIWDRFSGKLIKTIDRSTNSSAFTELKDGCLVVSSNDSKEAPVTSELQILDIDPESDAYDKPIKTGIITPQNAPITKLIELHDGSLAYCSLNKDNGHYTINICQNEANELTIPEDINQAST